MVEWNDVCVCVCVCVCARARAQCMWFGVDVRAYAWNVACVRYVCGMCVICVCGGLTGIGWKVNQ